MAGKGKKKRSRKNPGRKRKLVWADPCGVEELARRSGLGKRDARMMALAASAAYASDFESMKTGCVLGNKNVVISMSHNTIKSDPFQKEFNVRYRDFNYPARFSPYEHSIHAEIAALKGVAYPVAAETDWKKVRAYVFRLAPGLPLGQGLAKPCPACMHALMERGIRYAVYSTETGFAVMDLSVALRF